MRFIDRGRGTPLLFITGLQGRWEYSAAAVDALAERFRVITFPLADEPSAGYPFDRRNPSQSYVAHLEAVMDEAGVGQAIVCGLSFGGVLALNFAATRRARTRALILASTPGPGWHLRKKHEVYTRLPWLFGPLFLAETPLRLRREIAVAVPSRTHRLGMACVALKTLVTARPSPSRMAARARLIATLDIDGDCAKVAAPTLVITGEPGLDHVVHVGQTSEYVRRIAGATSAVIARTGHLGSITRPEVFAATIHRFVSGLSIDSRPAGARDQDVA